MICKNCGKEIEDEALFCPICGKKISFDDAENERYELQEEKPKKISSMENADISCFTKEKNTKRKDTTIVVKIAKGIAIVLWIALGFLVFNNVHSHSSENAKNDKKVNSASNSASTVSDEQRKGTSSETKKVHIPPMEYHGGGQSIAIYKGASEKDVDVHNLLQKEKKQFLDNKGYRINDTEKISTTVGNLIGWALCEYRFKKGEVYIVYAEPASSVRYGEEHGFCFCVVVNNDISDISGIDIPNFSYIGFSYDSK